MTNEINTHFLPSRLYKFLDFVVCSVQPMKCQSLAHCSVNSKSPSKYFVNINCVTATGDNNYVFDYVHYEFIAFNYGTLQTYVRALCCYQRLNVTEAASKVILFENKRCICMLLYKRWTQKWHSKWNREVHLLVFKLLKFIPFELLFEEKAVTK